VFSYLGAPFLDFSWKNTSGYSAQYDVVKALQKTLGSPIQIEKGVIEFDIPPHLLVDSTYHFPLHMRNIGQTIWERSEGYHFAVVARGSAPFTILLPDIGTLKPFEEQTMDIYLKTDPKPQKLSFHLVLKKNDETVLQSPETRSELEALPSLTVSTTLFPKLVADGEQFELQLFTSSEELIYTKKGLSMRHGVVTVDHLANAIPGASYRVVLLGHPYLPRQAIFALHKGNNTVTLKQLLPFDLNGNGRLDWGDLWTGITNPSRVLQIVNPLAS
jgi:hypothetical protein